MSEISREDAINSIFATEECNNKIGNCDRKCIDCELFFLQGTTEDYKSAIRKAISDMQKLEKIEQILDDIEDYEYEDCQFDLILIERILKSEQQ